MNAAAVSGRHLVLVGMMGAGKTSVGARCAAALGRPFVDTDALVEASAGMTVQQIFAAHGERGFRDLERWAVSDACASPTPAVIACGGGAVLDPENRRRLRDSGFVVWLHATPEVLERRVGAAEARPLLRGGSTAVTLGRLAALREHSYEAVADATVDTTAADLGQSVDVVLRAYEAAE